MHKGETAEQYIIESITNLGLTCTHKEERDGKKIYLTFSDGSAVRIGRYLTYTDPDGKTLPDCTLPQALEQILPVDTIRARAQLAALASRVDEAMFNRGYGHCVIQRAAHREIHMKFGGDVHAWVMDGSIMVDRPGFKPLKVKTPEQLGKILAAERPAQKAKTVETGT